MREQYRCVLGNTIKTSVGRNIAGGLQITLGRGGVGGHPQ